MNDEIEKARIIIPQPAEHVRRFMTENPEVQWRDTLKFVLDNYPQVQDDRVEYLLEGGAAMKLLFPDRQEPDDIDIIARSEQMQLDFNGIKKIDVKALPYWYSLRLPPYNSNAFNDGAGDFLFDMTHEVPWEGRRLLVLNPLGLAVSKTLQFGSRDPREKDIHDLALLQQDPSKVQEVIGRMRSVATHAHF